MARHQLSLSDDELLAIGACCVYTAAALSVPDESSDPAAAYERRRKAAELVASTPMDPTAVDALGLSLIRRRYARGG